jgi:hypothetical protein
MKPSIKIKMILGTKKKKYNGIHENKRKGEMS